MIRVSKKTALLDIIIKKIMTFPCRFCDVYLQEDFDKLCLQDYLRTKSDEEILDGLTRLSKKSCPHLDQVDQKLDQKVDQK